MRVIRPAHMASENELVWGVSHGPPGPLQIEF